MDATEDEIRADFYAHLYFDDPKAANIDEDEDFDPDSVAAQIGHASSADDWEPL